MSTCISGSAPHKSDYSYTAGTIVATFLWVNIVRANVLITLVVNGEEERLAEEVIYLKKVLESFGAVAQIALKENDVSCVLMGQTYRMLAYNLPNVR